jgi:Fur family ferric uptake transcriptional regulator
MQEAVQEILKKNQLSITGSRVKILELFFEQQGALAHGDIERRTGEKFDRVTVYRTLQVFLNKGIIHSIPTAENSVLYALCKDECGEGHHHDNHVHFVCDKCGNTLCLDDVTVPAIRLPRGYKSTQIQVVVNGRCKDCNRD